MPVVLRIDVHVDQYWKSLLVSSRGCTLKLIQYAASTYARGLLTSLPIIWVVASPKAYTLSSIYREVVWV